MIENIALSATVRIERASGRVKLYVPFSNGTEIDLDSAEQEALYEVLVRWLGKGK